MKSESISQKPNIVKVANLNALFVINRYEIQIALGLDKQFVGIARSRGMRNLRREKLYKIIKI